jgi:CheY-like chemotaxis protein
MPTILVVDDVALARESVARVLECEGFRAMKAGSGKEAWAMMYHDRPDLVLLDLMMPEMDGVTFLSMLRRSTLWHDLPVVVLTGAHDREQLITRAWQLGVSDLVPKATFGVEDLLARVRRHLPAADAAGSRRMRPPPRLVELGSGQACSPT